MPLDLTALEPDQLSPAVARVAGPKVPPPAKMMAARGLAPLKPADLVTAVYQLAFDADSKVGEAAQQTAGRLPDNILSAALGEEVDARVIDFFAQYVIERPPLVEQVLLNARTSDETFIFYATKLKERELEILAGNQQRLLRCPAIIEAFYFNKAARMSTVERMLELAVRNGLQLDNVPNYADFAASILGTPVPEQEVEELPLLDQRVQLDDVFSSAMEQGWDEGPLGTLEYDESQEPQKGSRDITRLPVNAKIRLATLGNVFHRMTLIRDTNRKVREAVIKSPGLTEEEVSKYAANRQLGEDIIRYIAEKREWLKNYQVKVALVNNPKCPLAHSMRLLPHLRPQDLRTVARSKNVPVALAGAAKRLMSKRG